MNKTLIQKYAQINLNNNFLTNINVDNIIVNQFNKNMETYNCSYLVFLINPYDTVLDCEYEKYYLKQINICKNNSNTSSKSSKSS